MLELEENSKVLQSLEQKLTEIGDSLWHYKLKKTNFELRTKTVEQDFWLDSKNSSEVLKDLNNLKSKVEGYSKIETELKRCIRNERITKHGTRWRINKRSYKNNQ